MLDSPHSGSGSLVIFSRKAVPILFHIGGDSLMEVILPISSLEGLNFSNWCEHSMRVAFPNDEENSGYVLVC